jgi:hypothetical protein
VLDMVDGEEEEEKAAGAVVDTSSIPICLLCTVQIEKTSNV